MEQPSIHTLIMMIRGFSNEVTVKGLAAQLGISYSTLARCKSGVWPPSITFESMHATLYDCRDRFFGGSDDSIAQAMLRHLRLNGFDTSNLEAIYDQEGFESFVTALLRWAQDPESQPVPAPAPTPAPRPASAAATAPLPDGVSQQDIVVEYNPSPISSTTPMHEPTSPAEDLSRSLTHDFKANVSPLIANGLSATISNGLPAIARSNQSIWDSVNGAMTFLYSLVPISIVLLLGLFGVPVGNLLSWAANNRAAFLAISLGIAFLPFLVAFLVDAPLAWHAYKRTHPDARYSYGDYALVAKYGDTHDVIPGAGRVNIFWPRCSFQALCNVVGALIYVSLLVFLESLPGFDEFLTNHNWVEFFKVSIVVAFLVSFEQLRGNILQSRPSTCDTLVENPDNYLPTRAHVWANTMHLVWTMSLVITLLLCLVSYSLVNFRSIETPLFMLLPIFCGMLFFAQAYASPYAIEAQCTDAGAFVPCVAASSLGFILLITTCYLPSWEGLAICALCIASIIWAVTWRRKVLSTKHASWLEQGKHASSYSVYFVAALIIMLFVGMLTSAFV